MWRRCISCLPCILFIWLMHPIYHHCNPGVPKQVRDISTEELQLLVWVQTLLGLFFPCLGVEPIICIVFLLGLKSKYCEIQVPALSIKDQATVAKFRKEACSQEQVLFEQKPQVSGFCFRLPFKIKIQMKTVFSLWISHPRERLLTWVAISILSGKCLHMVAEQREYESS